MKQTWKQIGSLFLSVCMVVTMLPVTAFAEIGTKDSGAGLGASGEITAFAALDEDIAVQTVDLGTAENKLNLPKKLKVTVTKTVTTTTGSAVTATVSGNDTATGSEAKKQEQQEETKEITEETTVEVSGWTSAPDYDGDVEGDYVFTPTLTLPEGLTLTEDTTLPTVTVTVAEEPAVLPPAVPQARGAAAPLGCGESVAINETNFPDTNFRNWLLDSNNLDGKGADGTLTEAEFASIDILVVNSQNIESLAGLEYFTALTSLYCRLNKLTTLPELPSGLERLNCSYNSLNELPTLPSGLIEIYCNDNKLTALPELPSSLEWLFCGSNALKTLPELPSSLTGLNCNDNKLTGVTLNGSATYAKIDVSYNDMADTSAVTGKSIDWRNANNTSGDANFIFYPQTTDTPATPLVAPTGLAWDDATPGKAKWNAVANASGYGIVLYKDGTEHGIPFSTAATATEYDFTSAITTAGAGSYTFKVQAMGDGTTWSDGPQSMASAEYNYTPGGASVDVSTEKQLRSALESTTAQTITVTEDIQGFDDTTILGADHTLNIADGKTVSIENRQFRIPEGKTLTLSGTGTLHVNPTSGSGIYVRGTLKLTVGSKLLSSSGLYLDDGMLVSTGGHITINNSGENSFGISNGAVTLSGGSLTIKNTGGQGISGVKLTVKDNCSVNVANVGDSYGTYLAEASFEGSTLNVANSSGYGIYAKMLNVTDCTVTATNTSGTGISVFDNNGNGNLTLKNSTIHLKNTGGMSVGRDATLMVDGSTINVDNGSGLGINSDGYLTGLNGGKLVLAVGARIGDVPHILSDRGYPYKYTGTATVIADNDTPSVEKLTAGEYVWNGSLFLKGTAAPTYSITVTGGTANPDTARGGAFVTLVPDEPPAGQHFKEWHCTGGNATFQYDETMSVWFFTMPHENVTVEAIFEVNPAAAYTVTVNGGTATPATAAVGETVTLTADAAPNGQRFSQWSISPAVTFTDGTDEYSESASFIMPNEAVTAMAAYEQDTSIALSILDTFVPAAYKDNITGPGISGGVSYDPATKTLTLNNAVISPSSGSAYGIFSQDDLTVNLVGQNRIGAAPNNPASEADYNVGVGIQSNKSLSITGEGSLTIYDASRGIYGVDVLTVDIGGKLVVAEYGHEGKSCCLKTEGVLTIKRGSLDLTSHNSKGLEGNSIVIEGGIISAQTQGGEHFAFSTMPSFGGGYTPSVFAGENAASAVKVTSPTAATFTASKYVRIQPVGAETYTIALNANGGSVSPTTMQTDTDGKLTSLPAPIRSGSYRFDGWFTAASGGTKVTASTVFRTNTTIYAHWTDTSDSGGNGGGSGSGGGSSSGGSSGSTTTPTTTPTTTTPGTTPDPTPVTATPTPAPTATLTESLGGTGGNLTLNIYENEEDNSLDITIDPPVEDILAAAGKATSKNPLELEIPTGSKEVIEYIRKSDAPQVKITLTIPDSLSSDENVNISNIGLSQELLEAAKETGKDITVAVADENGRELYSWTFMGSNLAGSKNELTDVNLALTLHSIEDAELGELLNENLGEEAKGMIISFGHEGNLPSQAIVRIYVGDQAEVKPGDRIYLYHCNPETGKLETLPYSSRYTVDKDGYITVDILHCSDYVVLPKEATANQITSLRNQIKVRADKTKLTVGDNKNNTAKIIVQLPTTLELVENIKDKTSNPALGGVTVSFRSSDTKVVIVDEDGLITAKGKGASTVYATITLYSKKIKTVTLKYTVK